MEIPIPDIPNEVSTEEHSQAPLENPVTIEESSIPSNPVPMETPLKKPTVIGGFETPNIRNSTRLDELYMSGIKRPRCEVETPSRKITKKELSSFIDRTKRAEENRKRKHAELKRQEDKRIEKITATTKKLSKKEIDELSTRLSMTPCRQKVKVNKTKLLPTATPAPNKNQQVFNRLYLQSTCKKRVYDEDEDEEYEQDAKDTYTSSISAKSQLLASKHSIQKVAEVFGDVQYCNHDEIIRFFKELSIIDESMSEQNNAIIEKVIDSCKEDEDKYNACLIKEKLIECFTTKKQSKFSHLVTARVALARCNERAIIKTEEPEDDTEEMRCAAKMQKETLERLLSSKPAEVPVVEEPEVHTKALSNASKFILAKSERTKGISGLSLEERDKLLLQKRDEIVNKLKEEIEKEEDSQMKQPTNLGVIPDFYEKLPEEKRKRSKKEDFKEEEPTFKPKTNSYEQFKKRNIRAEPKIKPIGWEQTVERIRLGRIERNRIQAELDIRNSTIPIKKSNMRFSDWKKKVAKRSQKHVTIEAAALNDAADIDQALGI